MSFSERTFEFCYNMQFCDKYAALLASYPNIPSQKAEGNLGYDVEFEIQSGMFTRSIFLQHKVVTYASHRQWNNKQFYDAHNGAYYRFVIIEPKQHNLLVAINKSQKGAAYYCAPRFEDRTDLQSHFRNSTILSNCVLIDPSAAGKVLDPSDHSYTFAPSGSPKFFHSKAQEIEGASTVEEVLKQLKKRRINKKYIETLSAQLLTIADNGEINQSLPKEFQKWRPIEIVQYLLGHVFRVSWILIS